MQFSAKAKRGLFIVIDGIDGSGKSTQAKLLSAFLKKQGKKVLLTHEPSRKTRLGREITKLTRSKKEVSKKTWVDLFTKERLEHQRKEILPALKSSKTVIYDRYYYSTWAYQLSEREWKKYALRFLKPDLALIFDVPVKEAMERIARKNKEQRIRRSVFENPEFLGKIREKFLKLRKFKEIRIINGNKSRREVFSDVKKEVKKICG